MTRDEHLWLKAPERPVLKDREVHVWRVELDQDEATLCRLADLLSPDELARAGKFYFRRDRDRFIAARGAVRTILSRYANIAPQLLGFSYSEYGKPALCGPAEDRWRFNVSHSNGIALCAVTEKREVGIDIEFVREDFATFDIAEHFFSRPEVSALRALPSNARTLAFFDCWTRKESYIKALGEGLSQPLDRFTVSLAPGEPAALLSIDEGEEALSRWSMVELFPAAGYRAALTVEGKTSILHCWRWEAGVLTQQIMNSDHHRDTDA